MSENQYQESARRMLRKYGSYTDARRECARLRDQSSWGTFTYAEWNATLKALEYLHYMEEA